MKNLSLLIVLLGTFLASQTMMGQSCWGGYTPSTNAMDCDPGWQPGDMGSPCCAVYKACNSYASPCPTYDPAYSGTAGCDMSCTPIDSGVLFLLIGGGLFGGFMIKRRRETELMPLAAK